MYYFAHDTKVFQPKFLFSMCLRVFPSLSVIPYSWWSNYNILKFESNTLELGPCLVPFLPYKRVCMRYDSTVSLHYRCSFYNPINITMCSTTLLGNTRCLSTLHPNTANTWRPKFISRKLLGHRTDEFENSRGACIIGHNVFLTFCNVSYWIKPIIEKIFVI